VWGGLEPMRKNTPQHIVGVERKSRGTTEFHHREGAMRTFARQPRVLAYQRGGKEEARRTILS